jgi:hypothetical protein
MIVTEEGDNHIPVELCATLLPGLLVLFFISHCDVYLENMFRMIELRVCCHEGRDSKAEEVCAFRQTLPILASFSRHQPRNTFDRGRMDSRSLWNKQFESVRLVS